MAPVCAGADTPKIALDTSETLFTVLTAINACGYDQELGVSNPLRAQVRSDLATAISGSPDLAAVASEVCRFYKEHQQADASREISQYFSLALYLG